MHEELAERGRLGGLLGALESELAGPAGPGLRQSTCVAVDPELIQTVDRMVDGYSVGDRRPSPVESSTRLRDSWGDADSLDFTEGSGAETAAQWLDRLRAITRELGMVSSSLYRYFASRDELLTALLVDAYTDLAGALESAAARPGTPDFSSTPDRPCPALAPGPARSPLLRRERRGRPARKAPAGANARRCCATPMKQLVSCMS